MSAIAVIALLLTLSSAAVAQKRARRDAKPAVIINVHRKNALALARHLDIATGSGFAGPSGIQQTTATRQALMFLGCNAVVVGSRDPAEMRDVAAAVGGQTLNTAPSRPVGSNLPATGLACRHYETDRDGKERVASQLLGRKLESAHLVFQPLLLEAHNMLPHHDEM